MVEASVEEELEQRPLPQTPTPAVLVPALCAGRGLGLEVESALDSFDFRKNSTSEEGATGPSMYIQAYLERWKGGFSWF